MWQITGTECISHSYVLLLLWWSLGSKSLHHFSHKHTTMFFDLHGIISSSTATLNWYNFLCRHNKNTQDQTDALNRIAVTDLQK